MVRGTERKLMKIFSALAIKEEEAVIPARRYLSRPRLALDCVRTAFSLLGFRLLLINANRRLWIIQSNQTWIQPGLVKPELSRADWIPWISARGGAVRFFECTY